MGCGSVLLLDSRFEVLLDSLKFATSLRLAKFIQLNVSCECFYSICKISRWFTSLMDLTMNLCCGVISTCI
jgi:hypothetical protein